MRDWPKFAGISSPSVPVIQRERQFAKKLHAYTLPRTGAPNSRVRDLVGTVFLFRFRKLQPSRIVQALQATFDLRATHPHVACKSDRSPALWTPFR
jgi:hypothetical protein